MPRRRPALAVAGHRLAGAPRQVVDVDLLLSLLDAAHRGARPVRRQAQAVEVVVGLERQVLATAVARHPGEPGEGRSECRIVLHEGERSPVAERDVALSIAHGVEAPDRGQHGGLGAAHPPARAVERDDPVDAAPVIEDVPGVQVAGGGALEERLVTPRVEIEQAHPGVDEALPSEDREEHRAAVGQEVGPEVAGLALRTVRLRQLFGRPPPALTRHRPTLVHAGLNRITSPGPQARPGVFSGRSQTSTGSPPSSAILRTFPACLNPIQSPSGERKGAAAPSVPASGAALERGEVVDQQASLGRERVDETPSVLREAEVLDAAAGARWHDREAHGRAVGRNGAPPPCRDTDQATHDQQRGARCDLTPARRPGVSRREIAGRARGPSLELEAGIRDVVQPVPRITLEAAAQQPADRGRRLCRQRRRGRPRS